MTRCSKNSASNPIRRPVAETACHLWFPYTPMTGTPPPFEAVATEGVRIRLADGTELIDGLASWWTACHGYNHPHILAAMTEQLGRMPHVMFGGLAHQPAISLSRPVSYTHLTLPTILLV